MIIEKPKYQLFITLSLLFFALIIFNGFYEIKQYKNEQLKIADKYVLSSIKLVTEEIRNKHKKVKSFSHEHVVLLSRAVKNPDDIEVLSELLSLSKHALPDVFALSIADKKGNIILDDFEGHIGEVCRTDLYEYINRGTEKLRVHPNSYEYHYDIVSEWQDNNVTYLIFMSFKLDYITQLISLLNPPDQNLMLVIKDKNYLIEITEHGSRINLPKSKSYNLTDNQISNILAEHAIPDTQWSMVNGLNSQYR